jgi:hypothetical protein
MAQRWNHKFGKITFFVLIPNQSVKVRHGKAFCIQVQPVIFANQPGYLRLKGDGVPLKEREQRQLISMSSVFYLVVKNIR